MNHAGWGAWLQGPGLCLALPCDGVLVPRHRCLAWAFGLLVRSGEGKPGLGPRPRLRASFNV